MKDKATLSVTSLFSIVFMTFHWADDMVREMSPGGVSGLGGVLILVVWLCGTLVLGDGYWDTSSCSSGRSVGWACWSST